MSAVRQRTFLGSDHSLAARVRVYRAGSWLEIDHLDYTEVERRRIPFLEVELVTLHARTGGFWGWVAAALAALCVIMAAAFDIEPAPRFTLIGFAFLFGLAAGYALVVPTWTVTVFGRRTSGRLVYRLRAGKARQVYAEIGRLAQEARETYREAAGPEPPPEPAPWLPPPPGAPEDPAG